MWGIIGSRRVIGEEEEEEEGVRRIGAMVMGERGTDKNYQNSAS